MTPHDCYTRRSVRKPHELRTMVEQDGSCSLAKIVTFSRDGVCVMTDVHSLPRRFDQVRLRFSAKHGDIIVRGDVRWSTPGRGKGSAFGVEFRGAGGDYTGFYDALPA